MNIQRSHAIAVTGLTWNVVIVVVARWHALAMFTCSTFNESPVEIQVGRTRAWS